LLIDASNAYTNSNKATLKKVKASILDALKAKRIEDDKEGEDASTLYDTYKKKGLKCYV